MREIKFRVWDYEKMTTDLSILDLYKYRGGWDRIEILQYTGLKDKNGKEIYEGDILKTEFCLKGLVFYDDGGFKLTSERGGVLNKKIFDELNNDLIKLNELKVIGNKYETPKLLGGE